MSVPNNTPSQDSALAVTLTVGELRVLIREEVQAANQNGHRCKMSTEPAKSYFKIAEAAKFSCLADSTIRFYMRKGQLKALKVGSRVIIKREDLDTFLEAHRKNIQPK